MKLFWNINKYRSELIRSFIPQLSSQWHVSVMTHQTPKGAITTALSASISRSWGSSASRATCRKCTVRQICQLFINLLFVISFMWLFFLSLQGSLLEKSKVWLLKKLFKLVESETNCTLTGFSFHVWLFFRKRTVSKAEGASSFHSCPCEVRRRWRETSELTVLSESDWRNRNRSRWRRLHGTRLRDWDNLRRLLWTWDWRQRRLGGVGFQVKDGEKVAPLLRVQEDIPDQKASDATHEDALRRETLQLLWVREGISVEGEPETTHGISQGGKPFSCSGRGQRRHANRFLNTQMENHSGEKLFGCPELHHATPQRGETLQLLQLPEEVTLNFCKESSAVK